jgi:hypothetical protein
VGQNVLREAFAARQIKITSGTYLQEAAVDSYTARQMLPCITRDEIHNGISDEIDQDRSCSRDD